MSSSSGNGSCGEGKPQGRALSLDELIACITAFFTEKGCQNWRFGPRFDCAVSVRIPVYTAIMTWDDAPPDVRSVGLREGWVMRDNSGVIPAQLWLIPAPGQQFKITRAFALPEVREFLEENLPTGEVLVAERARLLREEEAHARMRRLIHGLASSSEELIAVLERIKERFHQHHELEEEGARTRNRHMRALRDRVVQLVHEIIIV